MKYYHGTKAVNAKQAEDIGWELKATKAINETAIYVTREYEVAKKYAEGGFVLELHLEDGFEFDVVRPIDQRYVEDISLYSECAKNGTEFVCFNESRFHKHLDDVVVHKA